ncbi:MAG: hypothetical protein IPQ07_34010 [Myxococcales bacterium]|nr:hypothetical protein [Myxococcales bacterium]
MRFASKYLPLLALLGAVVAHADDAATAPKDPPKAAAAKKPAKVLTLSEMTSSTLTIEAQLKADLQFMEHLRTVVRRDKDVIKLNCVNDKYVQLKVAVNMFDQARDLFNGAAGNEAVARTHYESITKAGADGSSLRNEASGCVGVPELYKQESGIEVHHPDFPDDPTTATPFDDVVVDVEPPGYASPYN